jgi:tol-pal system protein YbgF
VLVAALTLVSAGCATLGGAAAPSSAEPSDVQDQLFKLQKDSALLLEKVGKIEKTLGDRGDRSPCAEAAARSEGLEREVRVLEEQILATQKRIDDVLVELRSQRRVAGSAPAVGAPSAAPVVVTPPAPAESGGPASPPLTGSPEDLFNAAYADYSRGNYELALSGFDAALRADAKGPLADDSQYWIGETLYARGQYLDAAAAFDKVITGWPKGDKVAVSHLKKGFALYEGKRTAEGVLELQRVIQSWPDSDEARLARDFLRRKGVVGD